jgi:ribokinase
VTAGDAPPIRGHVVVVGAINVDFVVAADRLPAPGETVVGAGLERHGGGKGANAAVAASRAGAAVRLVGAVGADDTATSALGDLREAGVDVTGVAVLDGEATGVALIVVDSAGENQIAVGAGANAAVSADWVRGQMREALPTAGCVLVSTEIPGEAVAAAVEAATAAGVRCVLNTAPPIPAVLGVLERGPVLTPNATELAALTAMLDEEAPPEGSPLELAQSRARRLVARTGAPIVVTLGGDGALLVTPAGRVEHVPPRPAEAVDTTGAGDTFNGVLATRLAVGDELDDAVRLATVAASLSISHHGARGGMPRAADIEDAVGSAR